MSIQSSDEPSCSSRISLPSRPQRLARFVGPASLTCSSRSWGAMPARQKERRDEYGDNAASCTRTCPTDSSILLVGSARALGEPLPLHRAAHHGGRGALRFH